MKIATSMLMAMRNVKAGPGIKNGVDAAKKLGHDGKECKWRRDAHSLSEEMHASGVAVAAEPAERQLRSMHKKDDSKTSRTTVNVRLFRVAKSP